jgi:hypothetical protein
MKREHNFVADLSEAAQALRRQKGLGRAVFESKSLRMRAIYKILKQTKDDKNTDDQSKFNLKRSICTAALISAVVADVEADSRIRIKALAPTYGMTAGTIFAIVHEDLGLVMKNARWVPKLLSQEQMDRRVETSAAFI